MTRTIALLLLPQFIMILAGVALMALTPTRVGARPGRMGRIAVLATALAAYSLKFQSTARPEALERLFGGMIVVDAFSLFFQWLFLVITGVCAFLSIDFNERESIDRGDYYALLLFACFGMSLMATSGDLIMTFLGIEVLSIASYVLAGFRRTDPRSNESSLKYFLLGSFATAILLYGIALIYGGAGSVSYQAVRELAIQQGGIQRTTLIGMGLLLVGFGFKLALVPFHSWAPDVYEGAPTPATAFLAVGSKVAGFAALLRILIEAFPFLAREWSAILSVLAIATMTLGNLVAIRQTNIKRMLAYSAIAHAGYILVGIVPNSPLGASAALFSLVAYAAMNLLAFAVVIMISGPGDSRVSLTDYAGLGRRAPFAAAALTVALLSLTGIPLTGGFMGKFYLFTAAIQDGYIGLAVIGVLNSLVSVYYYFRVIVSMYMRDPSEASAPAPLGRTLQAMTAIGVAIVLFLGIHPDPILALAGLASLALQ